MEDMEAYRNFLKAGNWDQWALAETDQRKKVMPPPFQKPYPEGATLIDLVGPKELTVGRTPLIEAINRRESRRKFLGSSLTLEELSWLLWATQGVRKITAGKMATRRTVPSGGSRHPFETYLLVNRVRELEPGLYRYLPLDHKLLFLLTDNGLPEKVSQACREQAFVGKGDVVFIWTAVPYRAEWRYSFIAHKVIALDAGHLCQNLYLASEAIDAGTCAIGAYTQELMDSIIGVDGKEEFVIYIATVGKI